MKAHEQALLIEAGLTKEQITEIEAIPDDKVKDFDFKPFVGHITAAQKAKIINDPEFYSTLPEDKLPATLLKKIESSQYGRFQNELKDFAVKELGLKEGEDFTPEDATKLKVFAQKITSKYAEKHGKKDVNEVQAQLQKALGEKTELEGTLAKKLEDAIAGEKNVSLKTIEKLIGVTKVAGIKDLSVKPGLIADSAMAALKAKYTVVYNPETLDFDLKQKASPTLAVLDKAGKEVKFDEALAAWAKEEGLVKEPEKKEEIDPATGKVKVKVDGDNVIPGYIKAKMGDEVKA